MCDTLQSIKSAVNEIGENSLKNLSKEIDDDLIAISMHTETLEAAEPTLLNLPVELFLKICEYLEADYLCNTVKKVCRRFEDILTDSFHWKHWLHSRINNTWPALPHLKVWRDLEMKWDERCVEIEKEVKKWTNVEDTMKHIVVKDVHFASVDTVLLVNNGEICISGGRDRGIAMYNVLAMTPEDENPTLIVKSNPLRQDAHTGWVWDLAPDYPDSTSMVYSASWDNTVKAWDLATGLTCVQTFLCGMSALSVVTSDNIVMAGLYSKRVLTFDIRVGPDPVCFYKPHRGPILALDTFDNMVASVSEDKTLAVWDRVAGKILTSGVKMPLNRAYPVCIGWSPAALYVGDSKGSLHLFDPEKLNYLKSNVIWEEPEDTLPACKITGCIQDLDKMILCSDRGEIKFYYNSYPPEEFASVNARTLDITQMRYQNDILVIGTCESAIEFWVPTEKIQTPSL